MTERNAAKSARDVSQSDWNKMSRRLDAAHINQDDFKRHKESADDLNDRIRAFDNPSSEETLRVIVD